MVLPEFLCDIEMITNHLSFGATQPMALRVPPASTVMDASTNGTCFVLTDSIAGYPADYFNLRLDDGFLVFTTGRGSISRITSKVLLMPTGEVTTAIGKITAELKDNFVNSFSNPSSNSLPPALKSKFVVNKELKMEFSREVPDGVFLLATSQTTTIMRSNDAVYDLMMNPSDGDDESGKLKIILDATRGDLQQRESQDNPFMDANLRDKVAKVFNDEIDYYELTPDQFDETGNIGSYNARSAQVSESSATYTANTGPSSGFTDGTRTTATDTVDTNYNADSGTGISEENISEDAGKDFS